MEGDLGAGLARLAGDFQLRFGHAAGVGLLPDLAVAPDLQLQPIGKRVHDGNAHAVQAAGNFVGVAVEFSAGVQHGHDHFGGGLFLRGVHVHGNAAAVVDDGDAVVVVHDDVDLVAVAGHGFVHGIVHHFPNEMMQALLAGRADVHRGALAHRFQAAEHFDRGGVVAVARSFAGHRFFLSHIVCVS